LVFVGISVFCGLQLNTLTVPEASVDPSSSPQALSATGTTNAAMAATAQRLRVFTRMGVPSRFAAGGGPRRIFSTFPL
jgi:hypothetical protein